MEALTIKLHGEIDHHNAERMKHMMELEIRTRKPRRLVLDFSGVRFMDSSGIGLLLGRYRQLKASGGELCVKNVSAQVDKVFQVSGMYQVIKKLG